MLRRVENSFSRVRRRAAAGGVLAIALAFAASPGVAADPASVRLGAEGAGVVHEPGWRNGAPLRLAQAQPAPASASPAGSAPPPAAWAVNCSNRAGGTFACEMVQAIIDSRNGGVLMLISINRPKDGEQPAALIRSIHGMYLPAGISVQVDKRKPTHLEFQKSDANGAYAALPLPKDLVSDLSRGTDLVLETEMSKGQKLQLKARLQGFAEAFDRVMKTK